MTTVPSHFPPALQKYFHDRGLGPGRNTRYNMVEGDPRLVKSVLIIREKADYVQWRLKKYDEKGRCAGWISYLFSHGQFCESASVNGDDYRRFEPDERADLPLLTQNQLARAIGYTETEHFGGVPCVLEEAEGEKIDNRFCF